MRADQPRLMTVRDLRDVAASAIEAVILHPSIPSPEMRALVSELRDTEERIAILCWIGAEDEATDLVAAGADECVLDARMMQAAFDRALARARHRRARSSSAQERQGSDHSSRTAFEEAAAGLALVTRDGRFLRSNERFMQMTGLSSGELETVHYTDIFSTDMREVEQRQLEMLFAEQGSSPEERRVLRPDGTHAWTVRSMALAHEETRVAVITLEDITSRRLAEEAVRSSERRFRFLCEEASDAIFLVSPEGRVIDTNQRAGELLGYRRDELVGRPFRSLFDSRDPSVSSDVTGGLTLSQQAMRRADDEMVPVEVSSRAIEGGGLLAIARDLTLRQQIDRTLRRTNELFQLVSRASSDGIYDWYIETDRLWLNETFRAEFGYPLHVDTVSLEWWEQHIHPDDRAACMQSLLDAVHGGADRWTHEYRFLKADGSWAAVMDRGAFTRENGRAVRMVGSMVNITPLRVAEEEARRSSERLSAVIDMTDDVIALIDRTGRISFVSRSIRRWLGRDAGDFTGREIGTLFHPDELPRMVRTIEDLLATPDARTRTEFRLRDAAGNWREFEAVAVNATDRSAIDGVLVSCRDVTDRRRLERQIAQSQRLASLGKLASSVAHEFNNVLMSIQTCAERIVKSSPDSPAASAAAQIEKSVARGRRISHDILDFTQPPESRPEAIDLRGWLLDRAEELRDELPGSHSIEVDADDLGTVLADPASLQLVVRNIVLNARDAMAEGGRIQIRARGVSEDAQNTFDLPSGHSLHLSVHDSGEGIPADVIDHIFEPLFSTRKTGSGLGLTAAHQAVERMGGTISAESEPGKGSVFHVFLPLGAGKSDQEMASARTEDLVDADGSPRRILLIEDEPLIAEGICALLEMEGFLVTTAATVAEARRHLRAAAWDLAILDVGLPDGDGRDVLRWMRAEDIGIPVIVSTGHGDRADIAKTDRNTECIIKPYEIQDLLAAIRRMLDH